MSALEWLLWLGSAWGVFLIYAACDAPRLVIRWKRGRR